jgi:acetyltransferase-like isoleucine patch superfamily enzyme
MLFKALIVILPWPLKRWCLQRFFGFELDPSARIGLAWIFPRHLRMGKQSHIDHLAVAVHLDIVDVGNFSTIGRSTWITGHPPDSKDHFTHQPERRPKLILGEHSAILKRHYLDCTHEIRIGRFTTIAGHQSELLTHSLDILEARQDSKPIEIGDYCFMGTRCIVLGGARLPSRSVLAAGSVLAKAYEDSHSLYGGVPARRLKELPPEARYFHRTVGFIH